MFDMICFAWTVVTMGVLFKDGHYFVAGVWIALVVSGAIVSRANRGA